MAWRIVGGLGGWLGSLAPLVIVNILAFTTALDPSVIPIAGGGALLLGIALGGALAGLLGGKRGAAWGGAVAGAVAAALLAGTLIALGVYLRAQHQLPYLLEQHPIRTVGAIGFIACLVVVISALVGAVAGRREAPSAAVAASVASRRPALSAPRPYPPSAGGQRAPSRPVAPSQPSLRGSGASRETRRIAESHPRERTPRW